MFQRKLQKIIQQYLFLGKIIIIYGARQVGKTTLVKELLSQYPNKKSLYLNGDNQDLQNRLKPTNYNDLANFLGDPEILVIDEAQRIENIGLILKILHDNNPKIQIIATGSSSFDLANKINEPLTGRSLEFKLFPLSIQEVATNGLEATRLLPKVLKFGLYPDIFVSNETVTRKLLSTLSEQYLYKDILNYDGLQKPKIVQQLLQLLAYQIGQEVSLQKLANSLDINKKTVEKYIDLLEKSFIVFTLGAYSKNLRNEIMKTQKIYFYDLGVRNTLITNFNELNIRNDIGALWENFCIVERVKYNQYNQKYVSSYFWRNYAQQEIDYIEESEGMLNTFEFKYNSSKKTKIPNSFATNYPNHTFEVVNTDNFSKFLL